jgi:hypothetical protein
MLVVMGDIDVWAQLRELFCPVCDADTVTLCGVERWTSPDGEGVPLVAARCRQCGGLTLVSLAVAAEQFVAPRVGDVHG